MSKVLAFDSWTGGLRHYSRLIPALKENGIELVLVHLGSWGGDPGRQKEEVLNDVLVRDISYYSDQKFDRVLTIEKPSAVLFLSTQTFAHRAMIRYCRQKKIPTILLLCGIMSVLPVKSSKLYKLNYISFTKFVLARVNKMLRIVWPTYIDSLIKTHADIGDYLQLLRDSVYMLAGKSIKHAGDSITDICLIYSLADEVYAKKNLGFTSDRISVVGNPDLEQFGIKEEMVSSFNILDFTKKENVMYVDTSLILRGSIFSNVDEYIDHLDRLRKKLQILEKHLILKLHPSFDATDVPERLFEQGFDLCEHKQFVPRLITCCSAIVEASTASLVPAYLGMPIFLAKFGKLKKHEFGEMFLNYPRAKTLNDLQQLSELFQVGGFLRAYTDSVLTEWIDINVGPKPFDGMPNRVAALILAVTQKHSDIN